MASEIRVTAKLDVAKGSFKAPDTEAVVAFDQTGDGGGVPGQIISTVAGLDITPFTGITTPGWAKFKNTHATDYVELGIFVGGTFYPVFRMEAGEPLMGRIAPALAGASQIRMKSGTGNAKVIARVYED
jgi:hypothetical protein